MNIYVNSVIKRKTDARVTVNKKVKNEFTLVKLVCFIKGRLLKISFILFLRENYFLLMAGPSRENPGPGTEISCGPLGTKICPCKKEKV